MKLFVVVDKEEEEELQNYVAGYALSATIRVTSVCSAHIIFQLKTNNLGREL